MQPPAQPAQARVATRHDLIALGQAGRPRDFIPLAVSVLDSGTEDPGVRFLLAANLASLGLRTLAGETLERLPEQAATTPDVRRLREAIGRLPDDRVPTGEMRSTLVGNLRALRVRDAREAERLSGPVAEWMASADSRRCFRCADGNIVRHLGGDRSSDWVRLIQDQLAIAARFAADTLAKAGEFPRPLMIEGLDPPWILRSACEVLARNKLGYSARITAMQSDPTELLDGLSTTDLRSCLVDPRVHILVGADASQRWLNDSLGRLETVVLGAAATLPTLRTRLDPALPQQIAKLTAAQSAEFDRLRRGVEAKYAGRDRAWWSRRFAEAERGGEPLRVLVPISRYSTFVRHSASDIAESLRRLGCKAAVHTEPTAHDQWSSVGHLRVVDEFEPDVILVINYFRGDAALPYPTNIPWICWLQDAMPHQFEPREWGELDFIAGHLHRELRRRPSFPIERAFTFPVVASTRKFHPEPVSDQMRARFECEIAYVSHQSETPDTFHRRALRELNDPGAMAVADALKPLVEHEMQDAMEPRMLHRLDGLVQHACDEARGSLDERARDRLLRHYVLPLADRLIRHSSLNWAAEICQRRGWRLRIFGRGWSEHPTLSSFARGDVRHGEELRACYQCAAVHLHASANTLVHQRVMECALSGGLPMCRLTHHAVVEALGWARYAAATDLGADHEGRSEWGLRVATADHPELMKSAALMQRLGLKARREVALPAAKLRELLADGNPLARGVRASWLLGDLAQTTFQSATDLERLVTLAVDRPAWRRDISDGIAGRARTACSTDTLADRLVRLVSASLSPDDRRAAA